MKKFVIAAILAAASAYVVAGPAEIEAKYNKSCAACHSSGAAGSPKKGDKAAWAPRVKKGEAALLTSVKNGLNAMPARGLCMDCSDSDYKSLIKYMSK